MLPLDTTTRKLQVLLTGAKTTNDMPVVVGYVDVNQSTFEATGYQSSNTVTNGTTPVDVLAVPGPTTTRKLVYMFVYNADTAAKTVIIRYDDNSTARDFHVTLQVGDTLLFGSDKFYVLDLNGATKFAGGVSSVFGRAGIVVATSNDYTWAQIDKTVSALADIATRPHSALSGVTADQHHAQAHEAAHISAGVDPFLSTDLLEAIVKRIYTSTGPTTLTVGAIADGEFLKRSGSGIISGLPDPQTILPRAAAGGSVDAITADFSPDLTLTDKIMCAVIAAGANTSATPTFAPDGLTAHTITKNGGAVLVAGDIAGAGFVAILEYNSANTRWELLNPKASGGGGTPGGSNTQIQYNNSSVFGGSANLVFDGTDLILGSGIRARMSGQNRFRFLNSAVRAAPIGTTDVADSTLVAIPLDQEAFDTDTLHDNATNNTRLTAAIAGKYLIAAGINYPANATGVRLLRVRLNGTDIMGDNIQDGLTSGNGNRMTFVLMVSLIAGDYIELMAFQTSGITLATGGETYTFLSMAYIGE